MMVDNSDMRTHPEKSPEPLPADNSQGATAEASSSFALFSRHGQDSERTTTNDPAEEAQCPNRITFCCHLSLQHRHSTQLTQYWSPT